MPRFHNLPFVDHLTQLAAQNVERWIVVGGLTPLTIAVLVAYIYATCWRHAHG